jgi:hypothetical protein
MSSRILPPNKPKKLKIDRKCTEKQQKRVLTDLADAFGSIRHSLIHFALEHYGLDQKLPTVIKSLNTDLSVSLELNGETVQITQGKGVFQGDCLSLTLFNIVINLILTRLNKCDITTTYGATVDKDTRITNAAFADDITLVAKSAEPMNHLLTALEDCIRWTKCLKAAPHKFVSRHYTKSGVISNLVRRQFRTHPK